MDLPDEILIKIIENLNVEDLKSISLVNSRFYELVTTTPSVNKKFKLNVDSNYNATIIEALMDSNRYFENISIPSSTHRYGEPCKSSQIIDLMKKVGGRVKNLYFLKSDIRIINVCPKSIFELLATLPNIESLMIIPKFISSECAERLPTSTTIFKFNQLKEVQAPFEILCLILMSTLEKLEIFMCATNDANYDRNSLELIEVLRNNQSTLKSLKLNAAKELFEHDIQVVLKILFYFINNITKPFLGFVHLESV